MIDDDTGELWLFAIGYIDHEGISKIPLQRIQTKG
jgi:hypothetical protein